MYFIYYHELWFQNLYLENVDSVIDLRRTYIHGKGRVSYRTSPLSPIKWDKISRSNYQIRSRASWVQARLLRVLMVLIECATFTVDVHSASFSSKKHEWFVIKAWCHYDGSVWDHFLWLSAIHRGLRNTHNEKWWISTSKIGCDHIVCSKFLSLLIDRTLYRFSRSVHTFAPSHTHTV